MGIKKVANQRPETASAPVTLTVAGNVMEVRYMRAMRGGCAIEKLNADYYLEKRTGEVKEIRHQRNRAADKLY